MAATNRTDKVKLLVKTLHKRYKHLPKPAERNLLECLMFAACLENATFDAAESAYSVLEHHYIDWNELRVSTPQEIADTLPMLPKPLTAGEHIKKTLQWVFETTYMFDLEEYRKKTIGQTVEYLDAVPSCTSFMTNYLVQIGLGGHQIPVDEASLRILRRLDLTKINNGREEVPGLERLVTKNKGVEFATMMHLFGMEFFDRQDDAELLALLKAIDKNAAGRSWQEPEGVLKKPDVKPIPAKVIPPPRSGGFKPEIDLDDEAESVTTIPQEEGVEFIETNLAALGASKDGEANDSMNHAGKKQSSGKLASSKKKLFGRSTDMPPEQTTLWKRDDEAAQKMRVESASKVEPQPEPVKKEKTDDKKADDKSVTAKKLQEKTTETKKPEAKKATPPKKETAKRDTPKIAAKSPAKSPVKKEPKKPDSQSPKKTSTKTTPPPKSATKNLQQKKPR